MVRVSRQQAAGSRQQAAGSRHQGRHLKLFAERDADGALSRPGSTGCVRVRVRTCARRLARVSLRLSLSEAVCGLALFVFTYRCSACVPGRHEEAAAAAGDEFCNTLW